MDWWNWLRGTTSTADGLDARVGAWNGEPICSGCEPYGVSELNVEIDANDGGYLTFSYLVKSNDETCWDWLDIYAINSPAPPAAVQVWKNASSGVSFAT